MQRGTNKWRTGSIHSVIILFMMLPYLCRRTEGFKSIQPQLLGLERLAAARKAPSTRPTAANLHSTNARTTKSIITATLRAAVVGSALGLTRANVVRAAGTFATPIVDQTSIEISNPLFPDMDLTEADFRTAKIVKKPTDMRQYQALLLPNKLRVLLVSDKSSNRGAAALDVHVGSFSDPTDIPGLAHFAEHMCFLGTKKYPDESDFSKFLSSHGGSSNAYTDSEDTVYYFDCDSVHLESALDRFSQFFSAPLFTASATSRELNAIDSEHAKNINNDGFRLYQLDKDSANPAHPYSKFSTGNKKTLEIDTLSRGINVRDELIKFHDSYYSANQMTLCVIGNQDLAQLEKWVMSKFSSIPNKSVRNPEYSWWARLRPFEVQNTAVEQLIVPVSDSIRRVVISWPIWVTSPDLKQRWLDSKPESVLAHLLGHEGAGSLRALLVSKGWANSVFASLGLDVSDLEQFEVSVDLTEEGLKNRYEVIRAVFGYIDLIKTEGIPQYIYDEVLKLSAIAFQFSENSDAASYASGIASDMQIYPPQKYLSGDKLLQPNADEVVKYLAFLSPTQARIKSISSTFASKTDKVAKWYNTKYKDVILTKESKQWESAKSAEYSSLMLPKPNILIPENFALVVPTVNSENDRIKALAEAPVVLRNDSKWLVFHKIDRYFAQPKVYAIISLSLSDELYDASFAMKARLFSSCFYDALNEYSYDASIAGLTYAVEFTSRGLQLTFEGFNDKFDVFVETILNKLKTFRPTLDTFDRFRDIIFRDIASWKSQQPYQHCSYFASLVTETLQFSNEELKVALLKTKLGDLNGFLDKCLNKSFGTALVIGNYDARAATHLIGVIESTFPFEALEYDRRSRRRIYYTPESKFGIRLINVEPNEKDENSATSFYFQVPSRNIEDYMLTEMLAEVIEQPFYDDLRTKQQLGYIVGSGARGREGIVSLTLTVQSSIVDGYELTNRVEDFIQERFLPSLDSLTEEEFESYKEGIMSRKLERDSRLTKHAGRMWSEIIASSVSSSKSMEFEQPVFNRRDLEVRFIKTLRKIEFVSFVKNLLSTKQKNRRLLISQVSSILAKGGDQSGSGQQQRYDYTTGGEDLTMKNSSRSII